MSGSLTLRSSFPSDYESVRILVVEDEPKLGRLLVRGLGEEGHPADLAPSGEEALWMARAAPYDAIVLDVMLPGIDGFATCRELRSHGVWTPVLMLTARDAIEDRISGLDTGADDYLMKPFAFSELLARLRAIARRAPAERPTELRVGDLRLDPATHRTWRGDSELDLTAKEFVLLEVFMRRPGEVLSRVQIWTPPGTSRSRAARTSSTSTSGTCERRSTGPSAGTRSRRCAASATG